MKLTTESTVVNDKKINTDIDNAQTTADDAKTIATDTAQYFWFTSSGTDTGAHISEQTRADFEANPSGGNLLANSNGIAVRDGLTELATFGATATIGKTSAAHMELGASTISMSDATDKLLDISASTIGGSRHTEVEVSSSNYKGYTTYSAGSDYASTTTGISTASGSGQTARVWFHKDSGGLPQVELSAYPSDITNGASAKINLKSANRYADAEIEFQLKDPMMQLSGNGAIDIRLDTSAGSGTTDGDLYAALVALGWTSGGVISFKMLDLKRWMRNVTQSLTPSCTQITLPYTPTKNGICLCLLRASAAGRAYVTLNNATPNIIDGYQVAGGYINGAVFATKGQTISVASSSNMQDLAMYFVSLG